MAMRAHQLGKFGTVDQNDSGFNRLGMPSPAPMGPAANAFCT